MADEYLIGVDVDNLVTAESLFGCEPASSPKPGAEVAQTSDAGAVWRGYPRTTWLFAGVTVEDYGDALTALGFTAGDAALGVAIYTRDEFDSWEYYEAMLRLPDPATLERWSGVYKALPLEFILLETTAPTP